MVINDIVNLMVKKPYLLEMGKGKLSKMFKCTPEDIVKAKRDAREFTRRIPKVLIFDTETAPLSGYLWSRWNQNLSLDATISEWFMLCWSAKWLYSNDVMGDRLTSEEALKEDDSRIMASLWRLIDEADIIVAHNAKHADIKWMNTRFIMNGFAPPKPYHVIDTLEVAKKNFGFSSNKLDALAGYFGIQHKMDTNFKLWKDCIHGEEEALKYMEEYNKLDTEILEQVYINLRPWIKNHPNMGNLLTSEVPVCSICASKKLELIPDKYYYTSVGKYNLYRCKDCGSISRGRVNLNKGTNNIVAIGR
jgi:hypothetical protein